MRFGDYIRGEQPGDEAAIRQLHRSAFGGEVESRIVDALRAGGGILLSLVAVLDDEIVGHVLYSPARIGAVVGAALGPMAVAPEHQRQGIGSRLVEEGHVRLRAAGCPFVVVVGHPGFYPRFGFGPASRYGIGCEWPVANDAFMIAMLDESQAAGVSGTAIYRPEFSAAG